MDNSGLVYGYYFNQDGTHAKVETGTDTKVDPLRPYWLHFDYTVDATREWLENESELNPTVISALLNEETRPRATMVNEGLLISLRGVNLAPNSDPEDMVSIRLWVDSKRIISTRRRTLLSVTDIVENIEKGAGPGSPAKLVTFLTERLMARMTDTINEIEDKVLNIEEYILTTNTYTLRNDIADLRRQIISLRRYLSPQRDAMLQLLSERTTLFYMEDKLVLRETTDHLIRYIEDLDSIKDRAAVTQEELHNRLAEQMNSRMYVLSIVAAIFLPLGFLTGLLGINVGGIPGSSNNSAFGLFIVFLVIVVVFQVWLFKKNKWF